MRNPNNPLAEAQDRSEALGQQIHYLGQLHAVAPRRGAEIVAMQQALCREAAIHNANVRDWVLLSWMEEI